MSLYPDITPYRIGTLKLTDGHTMYYEESGNPKGKPMLVLHGGPGDGISPNANRYANPKTTRTIAYDQRGCRKSKPLGNIHFNTTQHLIDDIERLRQHLGLESWYITGGSWGCTLALAYAEAHPQRVLGLTVAGIFLGTPRENEWFEGPHGAARFHPNLYRAMCETIGNPKPTHIMHALLKTLQGPLDKAKQADAAWSRYALACCNLAPDLSEIDALTQSTPKTRAMNTIGAHYHSQGCFLQPNQLLNNISRIAHIPLFIVQGALDMVCPPESALALHAAHPNSQLYWVELCGHRANKAGLQSRVRAIRDMLKKVPAPA